MTQHRRDLWPESIKIDSNAVSPVTILREQAAFLGEKTQNVVKAEVGSWVASADDLVLNVFYLTAPALDNYHFALFQIEHALDSLYPVKFYSETLEIDTEITTEDELLSVLEKAFSHERTISIINSMLVQSGASE